MVHVDPLDVIALSLDVAGIYFASRHEYSTAVFLGSVGILVGFLAVMIDRQREQVQAAGLEVTF